MNKRIFLLTCLVFIVLISGCIKQELKKTTTTSTTSTTITTTIPPELQRFQASVSCYQGYNFLTIKNPSSEDVVLKNIRMIVAEANETTEIILSPNKPLLANTNVTYGSIPLDCYPQMIVEINYTDSVGLHTDIGQIKM